MIIDKDTGAVHTDELIITPHLTRSEFLATMADRLRDEDKDYVTETNALLRVNDVSKDPFRMFIGLRFADQRLRLVILSFSTPDYDSRSWTATSLYLSKLLNDSIVRANLGDPHEIVVARFILPEGERIQNLIYNFDWGTVYSLYNDRNGAVTIDIRYK